MAEEDRDNSIAQLQEYSPRRVFTLRHTTPVLRAIQSVGETDNLAPATAHLCDGRKTTERHASDSAEHRHRRSLQASYLPFFVYCLIKQGERQLGFGHRPFDSALLCFTPY